MKYRRLLLFIALFKIYSGKNEPHQNKALQCSKDRTKTKIAFSKKTIDFGTISNDTNVTAVFYIKNIGKENLIINDVKPECSCTGFSIDSKNILSGDSTRLLINFSTKNKGTGIQKKAIIIKSNTEKEYNTLFIKCKILNEMH
jgi:hypothetical protein